MRSRYIRSLTVFGVSCALVLGGTPQSAHAAQTIDPMAPTQGFTVFTENNVTLVGTENEGSVALGGDLTLGNDYNINNRGEAGYVAPGDSSPSSLVVGGRVDFDNSTDTAVLRELSSGYVKIGDSSDTYVRSTDENGADVSTRILPVDDYNAAPRIELTTQQSEDSVFADSGIDFSAAFTQLRSDAAALTACPNTIELTTANGDPWSSGDSQAYVTLTQGETNVLNLDIEDLNTIQDLVFNTAPAADTPLLINVDTSSVGDAATWIPPNFSGIGPEQGSYILLNFATATSLDMPSGGNVIGTIYAPNAFVSANTGSNIDGAVVAESFVHGGSSLDDFPPDSDNNLAEIHPYPFAATLECGELEPTPSPTLSPSPSPSETTPSPSETTMSPTQSTPALTSGSTDGNGGLAETGSKTLPLVLIGASALFIGVSITVFARRRRMHE